MNHTDSLMETLLSLASHLSDETWIESHLSDSISLQSKLNTWFTPRFCKQSLLSLGDFISHSSKIGQALQKSNPEPKKIAVATHNTTPLDSFYDLFLVLSAGHTYIGKLKHNDNILFMKLCDIIIEDNPELQDRITFTDKLNDFDAVIIDTDGQTQASLEKYFSNTPHIFRVPGSAAAVLDGSESDAGLRGLSRDIYSYFGRSNYSVRMLFVPENYDFVPLLGILSQESRFLEEHNQFLNNLDYQKSINLMGQRPYLDAGTFIFAESDGLFPPTSVVHYSRYHNSDEIKTALNANRDSVSKVIAKGGKNVFGSAHQMRVDSMRLIDETLKLLEII